MSAAGRLPLMARRLVQLRWWWLAGLTVAVASAPTFLAIALPWQPLAAVLLLLAGFNLVAHHRASSRDFSVPELAAQLGIDLTGMTVLLYLTGGATNPLVSLLLLPVAMASLTLPGRWVAATVGTAIAAYSFLMLYSLPLAIADAERATRLHLAGMWLTFLVSAVLVAWFVTRMTASIRQRDALLAAAREEAMRDAQVVALGQLAAGAAHELGTPLATMNVLAGELLNEPGLSAAARADVQLLQQQIAVCKTTINGLTSRAGMARAGGAERLDVVDWLTGVLTRWRTWWPQATCELLVETTGAPPVAAIAPTLEQAVINLLNNAAALAPRDLCVGLAWDARELRIRVQDRGPGFPAEVLALAGTEPMTSMTQGAGIGLWLTCAAVEHAGGRLQLENAETGGVATIVLPLERTPT